MTSKEWTKCYSKSRKRDYYFNATTGQSVWSIEELNDLELESKLICNDKPKQSKLKLKAKDKVTMNETVGSPVNKRKITTENSKIKSNPIKYLLKFLLCSSSCCNILVQQWFKGVNGPFYCVFMFVKLSSDLNNVKSKFQN